MQKLPGLTETILNDFVSRLVAVQPNLIEGVYLTGSIPLGDYYTKKSDIDFITILKDTPDTETIKQFEAIHLSIEKKYAKPDLNGYYLTLEGIQNNQQNFPSFFGGVMQVKRPFELDKVTLFELQTTSLTILGKPAIDLPIQITVDEVITQLHQNINSYWTNWVQKHAAFTPRYLLLTLFPRLTEWGVLGVARQLYTLDMKKITSKHDAGLYCLDRLPKRYHAIITTTIETRKINKTQLKPSLERANKTIDCMEFIIDSFNETFYKRKDANSA